MKKKFTVKYWRKDKSFTATTHEHGAKAKFLYDGRSKEYMDWWKSQKMVVFLWTEDSVEITIDNDNESGIKRGIVFALFEATKQLGITK